MPIPLENFEIEFIHMVHDMDYTNSIPRPFSGSRSLLHMYFLEHCSWKCFQGEIQGDLPPFAQKARLGRGETGTQDRIPSASFQSQKPQMEPLRPKRRRLDSRLWRQLDRTRKLLSKTGKQMFDKLSWKLKTPLFCTFCEKLLEKFPLTQQTATDRTSS